MIFRLVVIGIFIVWLTFVGFSFYVSQPAFDQQRDVFEPLIADKSEAMTFARSEGEIFLVASHEVDSLTGIDLSAYYNLSASTDLLEWLSEVDQTELLSLTGPLVSVAVEDLVPPVNYTYPYIAAGTNFKEHAEEVYLDDPPFLFPKLARAGNWQDDVPLIPRLDYEAELCVFPLADINADDAASGNLPDFGLVLCNDFTDRWTLIKELDLSLSLIHI